MEIHPPTKPIESVKDFFLHLAMITIGILIALGLEQAVEAWHHHELGLQARENILSEIRDNKREIENERKIVSENRKKLEATLQTLHVLMTHKPLHDAEMTVKASGATLNSTSWTTAQATGALAYMGYAEAKKFVNAYELQALLQRAQQDEFKMAASALTQISAGMDPTKMNDEQLRNAERDVLGCLASNTMWEQLAQQLSVEYDRVLKER